MQNKPNIILINCIFFMLCLSLDALSLKDYKGTFTIDYIPKRIVVLELSFADALAIVDIKPIGIADDNDERRLIPELRKKIGTWQSVGIRSQPNLEVISSLKPDLIIADIRRHEAIYESLKKIAPTLILPSKRTSYKEVISTAKIIAKVVGKSTQIKKRLEEHELYLKKMSKLLPQNIELQVSIAKDDQFFLYTSDSFIADVINKLGLKYAKNFKDDSESRYASLEQLLSINPQYLIVGEYVKPSIIQQWKKKTLWNYLRASKKDHLIEVEPNLWARSRGILAIEHIVQDLVSKFAK